MLKVSDISSLVKQAQQMQEKLAEIQNELEKEVVTASAGGGMVTVTANAKQEILNINIEPEVVNPNDIEMLTDLIIAAVNQALANAREVANEKMSQMTGGMLSKLPTGFKLPGM